MLCIRKYEQAIDAYGVENKPAFFRLYFNLGCYYKLNKVAPAIIAMRGLVLSPNDKEILNNLKFAQKNYR
jgi:hypothetical protein